MVLLLTFFVAAIVGVLLLRVRAATSAPTPRAISPITAALCCCVAIPSFAQFAFPGLFLALRRDADRILHHGQWWRVATSLVVQDGGVAGTVFNLVWLVGLAALATTLLGDRDLLILFGGGGIVGELVALRWQPIGAGNSVGNLGLAGGILALAVLHGTNLSIRLIAGCGIALGVILLIQRDIHGAALLAGVAIGLLLLRSTASQ